jgi:hypothetical protein
MTTADDVRERALSLARSDVDRDEAVRELELACGGRRVAAVRARQQLTASLDGDVDQAVATAIGFLDELLAALPA